MRGRGEREKEGKKKEERKKEDGKYHVLAQPTLIPTPGALQPAKCAEFHGLDFKGPQGLDTATRPQNGKKIY